MIRKHCMGYLKGGRRCGSGAERETRREPRCTRTRTNPEFQKEACLHKRVTRHTRNTQEMITVYRRTRPPRVCGYLFLGMIKMERNASKSACDSPEYSFKNFSAPPYSSRTILIASSIVVVLKSTNYMGRRGKSAMLTSN